MPSDIYANKAGGRKLRQGVLLSVEADVLCINFEGLIIDI